MSEDDPIVQFVAWFEGFRSAPYLDVGKVWTIGYGFTYLDGEHVGPKTRHLGRPEALALLGEKIGKAARLVQATTAPARLEAQQLDALASLVFNIGEAAWRGSTIRRLVANEKFAAAAEEFPKWCHVDKSIQQGLVFRRYWERHLFTDGFSAIVMLRESLDHAGHVEPVSPDAA